MEETILISRFWITPQMTDTNSLWAIFMMISLGLGLFGFMTMFLRCIEYFFPVPNYWDMTLSDPWYSYVLNGQKVYEGRRMTDKVKKFKIGDIIYFSHSTDLNQPIFRKRIVNIIRYPTFEIGLNEFHERNQLQLILPNVTTVSEGVNIYERYVSIQTQLKDGICFIKLAECD